MIIIDNIRAYRKIYKRTEFSKFINTTKNIVNTAEEKRIISEQKVAMLNSQNQKWIAKTQAMIEKMHKANIKY